MVTFTGCGEPRESATTPPPTQASTPAGELDASPAAGSSRREIDRLLIGGRLGKRVKFAVGSGDELLAPAEAELRTVVRGGGDVIEEGDIVTLYVLIANASTGEILHSDHATGAPDQVPFDRRTFFMLHQMMDGATYGSRVVALADYQGLLRSTSSNREVSNPDDPFLMIADFMKEQEPIPPARTHKVVDVGPWTQPRVIERGGLPAGLDFEGIREPALDEPVQRVILREGLGPRITRTSGVALEFLGSVYGAVRPFDDTFGRNSRAAEALPLLSRGWSIGLDGVREGSRVLLQVPPALSQTPRGRPPFIPEFTTVWFVIDVVAVHNVFP